ncbi:MAG: integrin alpha, partial [Actinomycetota bacterium]|nr:integrin alpha [Actinomycetota bacterium]
AYPGGSGNTPIRTLTYPDSAAGGCSSSCGSFGLTVQGPGDINGDRVPDQMVAAPTYQGSAAFQGRIYVFSGLTGDLLRTIDDPVPQAFAFFGFQDVTPNSPGDVNGDGKAEIYGEGWLQAVNGVKDAGEAWVFSGATGAVLFSINDPHPHTGGQFGWSMTSSTYANSPTRVLLMGASPHDGAGTNQDGGLNLFNSQTGRLLKALPLPSRYQQSSTPDQGPNLGWTVAAPGVLNHDGYQEYLGSAPFWNSATNVNEGLTFTFYAPAYAPPYCEPNADGSPTGLC